MGTFGSTPTYKLFERGLTTGTIKKFRGINAFESQTSLGPEWALNCLNVMIPGWGGLSKFRLPVTISPITGAFGPNSFIDFQQGNGTRQVVANIGSSIYFYLWNADNKTLSNPALIESAAKDAPPWSWAQANNILFGANGQRMMKWLGIQNGWRAWGIAAPLVAPKFGGASPVLAPAIGQVNGIINTNAQLSRLANVVTISFTAPNIFFLQIGQNVTVLNATDPSFNGTFAVTSVVAAGTTYTFAQVGPNVAGPVIANATAPAVSSVFSVAAAGAVRVAGLTTITAAAAPIYFSGNLIPPNVTVAAVTDASFDGTFPIINYNSAAGTLTYSQPGLPDSVSGTGTFSFGITEATGRQWAYAYMSLVTGTISNISPPLIGQPLTNQIPVLYPTLSIDPRLGTIDPQIDAIVWFATLDGGGDFFQVGSPVPLYSQAAYGGSVNIFAVNAFFDTYADSILNTSVQGPLLNGIPPVGKYLAVGQSRVFVFNLQGAEADIAYSGYEQILYPGTQPTEAFPPNNRLHLSIGAESIAGGGIIQAGIVAFSNTKRMYMLRGQVEDISVSAPVQFSAFLEELPWNIGTLCHQSIQATPYGLIFWASDKTVQFFDGRNKPQDVSSVAYPLLRAATPGLESQAWSGYFNWLERDWYVLSFSANGSASNNTTIIWSLQSDANGNSIDIFPTSIQCDSIQTLTTPLGQRILAIGQGGAIKNLPVSQDTNGGISDLSIIPDTNGVLNAFWQSGYFGNDTPQRSKMYRRGKLITDQGGFKITKRLVDDIERTIINPEVIGPDLVNGSQFRVNRRGTRCSIEIGFPSEDVSANVLELSLGGIASSDR